jgi:sulfur-carrier protein adenylyltransferase/sulfurtransferase
MPDAGLASKTEAALDQVDCALAKQGAVQRLSADELLEYANRGAIAGWRLSVQFADRSRRLDVLACRGFPWTPVLVALVDRPAFLTWPHIEKDGIICLALDGALSRADSGLLATHLLGEACKLIERLIDGDYLSDFREEFSSYWDWATTADKLKIASLCTLDGVSRVVRCWDGGELLVIADNDRSMSAWLEHAGQKRAKQSLNAIDAVLAFIGDAPLPREFPNTSADLLRLVRSADPAAACMIEALANPDGRKAVIVLCAETTNGPALAGISLANVTRPSHPGQRRSNDIVRGFRPDQVPKEVLTTRFFGAARADRVRADRVDPSWIHGRDADSRFPVLRKASVVVVGCGSLGAPVAEALARAGVGGLTLVDHDALSWANVGRHVLGAQDVGATKAQRLASKIRRDLPHICFVKAFDMKFLRFLEEQPEVISNADLIVAATGDWGTEAMISDWHIGAAKRPPVVFGWAEDHACAGHAVALARTGACLRCGFDEYGRSLFRVTKWPNGTSLRKEPGCGAVFQPYGPVEMSYISSTVVELALDVLLGTAAPDTHRIWAARKSLLQTCGGEFSDMWTTSFPEASSGGMVRERVWSRHADCDCGKLAAA